MEFGELRSKIRLLFAAISLITFGGCGTFVNVVPSAPFVSRDPQYPPFNVYGGLKRSVGEGRSLVAEPENPIDFIEGVALLGIDSPLCVVTDTITLPITVPLTIDRGINEYYFPKLTQADRSESGERSD